MTLVVLKGKIIEKLEQLQKDLKTLENMHKNTRSQATKIEMDTYLKDIKK